jgi:murein DD-endopeptidase MepM/ murein hydrolase activator NlpD
LSSTPSPALRALRRLVARDPEIPIRIDLGSPATLEESLRGFARKAAAPAVELLGSSTSPRALTSYRRLLPLGTCLLIVLVAAATALAPVSAANAGPQPQAAASAVPSAADSTPDPVAVTGDQTTVDATGGTYAGDGSIYNVMEPVDIAPGSSGFKTYVVQGGDNLNKIAAKFSLGKAATVYWANRSRLPDPGSMRVGLKLLIPPVDGMTVTVKAKDTLSSLASKYHSKVALIAAANGLADSTVTIGQTIVVPCTPAAIPVLTVSGGGSGGGSIGWTGGKLRWPVPASRTITQYYSASRHPAIDIGAPTGDWVVAAVRGRVIWAGWKYSGGGTGGGIEIWIDSGGKLYTTYNHLSAEFVSVGQVVAAGQHIGNVGQTGHATGPHLHFEVWICYPWTGGNTSCARNPLNYM